MSNPKDLLDRLLDHHCYVACCEGWTGEEIIERAAERVIADVRQWLTESIRLIEDDDK